jgi:outer membrane protein TolC
MAVINVSVWQRPLQLMMVAGLSAVFLGDPVSARSTCTSPKSAGASKSACVTKADGPTLAASKKPDTSTVLAPTTFKDVVAFAIGVNPQIAFARSQYVEARAGVGVAEANNGIQLDGSLGAGVGAQGTTNSQLDQTLFQDPNFTEAKRYIGSLSSKKLLYDFGSTETSISRANALVEAQRLALESKVNDIGYSTADAYTRVFQNRELSKLNQDNITALEKIQELVKANEANGNGTVADVKRVEARLVDARAVAADTEADLQTAVDSFRRLAKGDPGDLQPAPDLSAFIPAGPEQAIAILKRTSPHLLSLDASIRAANLELESKKQSLKPQFMFQTDTTMKSYQTSNWNNFDAQAIVSMSYKFMDGGLAQSQIGQLLARIEENEHLYANDRDQAEADLRKFYTTIDAARSKTQSLEDGVTASASARDLYTEQFSGGKRTLFELLDIQTAYFNAKRAAILNMFDERRSVYSILQTLGFFVTAANGEKNALVADASAPTKAVSGASSPVSASAKAKAKASAKQPTP